VCVCVCRYGFCNVWSCAFMGFLKSVCVYVWVFYVWVSVCMGFVMFWFVYVRDLQCVVVCMFGFCNVWVWVCIGFVMSW